MKQEIENLIQEAIALNPSLFLVECSISPEYQIKVLVDGDDGLPLEEIIRISRHIEHNLDREKQDFSLEVSSPGLSSPLLLPRQYQKNIGRTIEVQTNDGKQQEGELTQATENEITIQWKQREPKPIGKGKHTVQKQQTYTYTDINKAIIKVKF